MIPLLFLDMDGVLNNREWLGRYYDKRFAYFNPSPLLVHELNKIIYHTGAQVVLSSVWRGRYKEVNSFRTVMDWNGFQGEIVGFTPRSWQAAEILGLPPKSHIERGHEIEAWLQQNRPERPPFIILDDDSDMAHLMGHLVKTQNPRGLQYRDVERAIEHLQAQQRQTT